MIRLKVNGNERTFDGDPDMPLLWYLRDVAGLTGTKFGCGMSLCGACTVHQNGEAIRPSIGTSSRVSHTSWQPPGWLSQLIHVILPSHQGEPCTAERSRLRDDP